MSRWGYHRMLEDLWLQPFLSTGDTVDEGFYYIFLTDLKIRCWNCPSKLSMGSGTTGPRGEICPVSGLHTPCQAFGWESCNWGKEERRKTVIWIGTSHCPLPLASYLPLIQLFGLWSLDVQPPTVRHMAWATSDTEIQKPWSFLVSSGHYTPFQAWIYCILFQFSFLFPPRK